MQTQHTTGPWLLCGGRYVKQDLTCIGLSEDAGRTLATVPGGENSGPSFVNYEAEISANARLMTAAPELLESLRLMVDLVELAVPIDGDTLRRARAAIAKATGEQP